MFRSKLLIFWFPVFLLFAPQMAIGQREGNNWCFGNRAYLDFKADYPKPTAISSTLNADGGISSISDASGNLLLYTDGQTLWNGTHGVISASLWGSNQATQSSLILKQPETNNRYFIFTVDKAGTVGRKGLTYSVVDLSLGTGPESLVQTNTPFPGVPGALFTEKITAIKHGDGKSYWIITHEFGNWAFDEFLLTANGLVFHNQILAGKSHPVDPLDPLNHGATGYLKASPKGDLLVAAIEGIHQFELFSFDHNSGLISFLALLPAGEGSDILAAKQDAYGVEFSSTGRYLYGSSRTGGLIYQWDLASKNQNTILGSTRIVRDYAPIACGALQLAPNGKIYVAMNGQPYLGVINSADFLDCNFRELGASLKNPDAGIHGISGYGLPNLPAEYFRQDIYFSNNCSQSQVLFYLDDKNLVDSPPEWRVDNAPITTDPITYAGKCEFSVEGSYTIYMRGSKNGNLVLRERLVQIHPVPDPGLKNIPACTFPVELKLLNGPWAFWSWWDDNTTDVSRLVNKNGTYQVAVTNYEGCVTNARAEVAPVSPVDIDSIVIVASACNRNNGSIEIFLKGGTDGYQFIWSNPDYTAPVIRDLPPDVYSVTIKSIASGCSRDTSLIVNSKPAQITIQRIPNDDSPVCAGQDIFLRASGADTYIWSNPPGATAPEVHVIPAKDEVYAVTGIAGPECSGTAEITVRVLPVDQPVEEIRVDSASCNHNDGRIELVMKGSITDYEFAWSDSNITSTIRENLEAKEYEVTITIKATGCRVKNSIRVGSKSIKVTITRTPGDSAPVCPGDPVTLEATGAITYQWDHQLGQDASLLIHPLYTGWYAVTGFDNTCTGADSIRIEVKPYNKLDLGPDRSTCAGVAVTIEGSKLPFASQYASWLWSPIGSTAPDITVSEAFPELTLQVTDINGCTYQDTIVLIVNELPSFTLLVDSTSCPETIDGKIEVKVDGNSGFNFSKNNGTDWSESNVFSGLGAGTYTILVKNLETQCISLPSTCEIAQPLPVTFEVIIRKPTCTDCSDGQIAISAISGGAPPYEFEWKGKTTTGMEFVVPDLPAGTYELTVKDQNGCPVKQMVEVIPGLFRVPDAFSPNAGGDKNQTWVIESLEGWNNCLVRVYDPSGKLVFERAGSYIPWNGTDMYKGRDLPAGTYFYLIQIDMDDPLKSIQRGTITILR